MTRQRASLLAASLLLATANALAVEPPEAKTTARTL